MKTFRKVLPKATIMFLLFTALCGIIYTALVTGLAQLIFPYQANGSLIVIDGKKQGCALLGQQFTDPSHLWGRIVNLDVTTYKDRQGRTLVYAAPSNLSPASPEFEKLVAERVAKIRASHPEKEAFPIPVDLVTCSGSSLAPRISPAAAEFQVTRIARARSISEEEVRQVIARCTTGRFLGLLGEPTVNVLEVNLILDGKLR